MHRDLRGGAFDLPEIVWGKLDVDSAEVLLQTAELRGTWDGNNPRLLGEQPRDRDLRRGRLLLRRDPGQQIYQVLIRLPVLRCEARDRVAEVGAVERRALVNLPREEALAQRAEGNEADPELLEDWQDLLLGLSTTTSIRSGRR